MLKINKDTFELKFFQKTPIYQKQLLIAFSIALFFHLLFFTLFQITVQKGYDSESMHFKISLPLQKFMIEQNGSTSLEVEKLYETKIATLNPPYTEIELPKIVPSLLDSFSDYLVTTQIESPHSSLEIEEKLLLNIDPLPLVISYPQFTISAHGLLSDKIIETAEAKIFKAEVNKIKSQKVLFDVIVDNASGKIIWFEAKENKPLAATISHLLQKILFLLNQDEFITKGQIEIAYHD